MGLTAVKQPSSNGKEFGAVLFNGHSAGAGGGYGQLVGDHTKQALAGSLFNNSSASLS
jgi:hypothetical protein